MPVDRDPGPCLALLASFLPHERRSSKSECGRNAASSFTALEFPLYCLVLSCLIHLGPPLHLHPHPRPPLRLTHCSPSPLFGLGPVRLCNVHHSLVVPYPASLPACQSCQSCQPALPVFALPCVVLYIDTSGYSLSTVRTVPCHPAGCRNRIAGIIPQEYFTHWMTAQRVDA